MRWTKARRSLVGIYWKASRNQRRLMEARLGKKGKREYVADAAAAGDVQAPGSIVGDRRCPAAGCDLLLDAVKHLLLCWIEQRLARLDLENYPHLPTAQVATTAAADYLALLSQAVC